MDSPLNPNLEGGPAKFEMETPAYADLVKLGRDLEPRGETVRVFVTVIGEIRTKDNLVIVHAPYGNAPYGKGNLMGNGYGEGGAFAAMLVVKTFRNARVVEGGK